MSRKPLPITKFEPSMTTTVEMTEIDGMKPGAILRFTDIGKSGRPSETKELHTCYGDLYVIVNALRDYANLLKGVIQEWELSGFQAAAYELHAARCRKIAGKYAASIDYDYDKALERCERRRSKGKRDSDTGMDGLEAFLRMKEIRHLKQEKSQNADSHQKGNRNENR